MSYKHLKNFYLFGSKVNSNLIRIASCNMAD